MQCEVYIGKRRKPVPANKSAVPRFFKQLAGRTPLQSGKRTTVLQTWAPLWDQRWVWMICCANLQKGRSTSGHSADAILESVLLAWSTFSWKSFARAKQFACPSRCRQESQWTLVPPAPDVCRRSGWYFMYISFFGMVETTTQLVVDSRERSWRLSFHLWPFKQLPHVCGLKETNNKKF